MDTIINPTDTENTEPQRWRDVLPIHPAAELFPLMSEEELRELAADIGANDLVEPVAIYRDPDLGDCLLDGRNRLERTSWSRSLRWAWPASRRSPGRS
jgi:hypothetical protein